jgi:rRNA biogenesis protein RRP5
MARIVSIRQLELIVSLPNSLWGHIPATSISSHFTKSLQDLAGEDSDEEGSDSGSEASTSKRIPTLADMYQVGEFVTAAVANIKTADASRRALSGPKKADEEYRMSRRVELSLDPGTLHEGIRKTDLVPGLTLSAAVQSIEDNGYILDLGVEGVTSFVSTAQGNAYRGGDFLCQPSFEV